MASGKLGNAAPIANTNTTVYTVPAGKVATFNISIANTYSGPVTVSVAIASSGSPSSSEWIEYNAVINPYDVLERTALVAAGGEQIVVNANETGLAVRVHGFEQ